MIITSDPWELKEILLGGSFWPDEAGELIFFFCTDVVLIYLETQGYIFSAMLGIYSVILKKTAVRMYLMLIMWLELIFCSLKYMYIYDSFLICHCLGQIHLAFLTLCPSSLFLW